MIIDGRYPNTLEAQVLMAAHIAGAKLEIKHRTDPDDRWEPRDIEMIGQRFVENTMYRLAENQDDN